MGLIARHLEAAGIPTLSMTSAYSITRSVNPPRAAFLDYPLGHTTGRANEPEANLEILRKGFKAFELLPEPGMILGLPQRWAEGDEWRDDPMGARKSSGGDSRTERFDGPRYQSDEDQALAEAVPDEEQCLVCIGIEV